MDSHEALPQLVGAHLSNSRSHRRQTSSTTVPLLQFHAHSRSACVSVRSTTISCRLLMSQCSRLSTFLTAVLAYYSKPHLYNYCPPREVVPCRDGINLHWFSRLILYETLASSSISKRNGFTYQPRCLTSSWLKAILNGHA